MDSLLIKHPYIYFFRENKRSVFFGLLALALTNLLDALPPLFIGKAIDSIGGGKTFFETTNIVGTLFAIVLALAIARFAWRLIWGYFTHTAARSLQNSIFKKFGDLSLNYLGKNPVGELVSLITNDVSYFRMALGPGVILMMDAITQLLILPPLMYSISPSWTWKTLIFMPAIPFLMTFLAKLVDRLFEMQQTRYSELSGFAQEMMSGIRVIKSFAQEDNRTEQFNVYSRRYEDACNKAAFVDASFMPVMGLAMTLGSFILLLVGAPEVIQGSVTIGAFFAFYQYIDRMVWPMSAIGFSLSHLQQGNASFTRIRRTLESENDVQDKGHLQATQFDSLEVRHLTFLRPDREKPVLNDINFSIRRGETIGIIGLTGSGKSSLIDLLCRLQPLQTGGILLNGTPIDTFQLADLRRLITVVPQEAFLFSEKIRDNLTFGDPLADEDIRRLCSLVEIDDEILSLQHRYDTYLGERGVNLSGGQKQRLTIARALAKRSELLILDDALSAIDPPTEKRILQNLRAYWPTELSVILVSHRVESVKWADRILVLNHGVVEAWGSHDECLKQSATYRELCLLQQENPDERPVH